jgi:hypothetical protein
MVFTPGLLRRMGTACVEEKPAVLNEVFLFKRTVGLGKATC